MLACVRYSLYTCILLVITRAAGMWPRDMVQGRGLETWPRDMAQGRGLGTWPWPRSINTGLWILSGEQSPFQQF